MTQSKKREYFYRLMNSIDKEYMNDRLAEHLFYYVNKLGYTQPIFLLLCEIRIQNYDTGLENSNGFELSNTERFIERDGYFFNDEELSFIIERSLCDRNDPNLPKIDYAYIEHAMFEEIYYQMAKDVDVNI